MAHEVAGSSWLRPRPRRPPSEGRWRGRPARTAAAKLIPRHRIGIQLFTVRTLAEADLPGTLALLARIGYREIEVAGLFGRTPEQFRALMRANRLHAVGGHQLVGPALIPFFGDREVEDALDEAETLGQPYVGTAGITIPTGIVDGVGEPQTAERYKQLAELANQWGAAARRRRMKLYLHVHYWEFGRDPSTGESRGRDRLLAHLHGAAQPRRPPLHRRARRPAGRRADGPRRLEYLLNLRRRRGHGHGHGHGKRP